MSDASAAISAPFPILRPTSACTRADDCGRCIWFQFICNAHNYNYCAIDCSYDSRLALALQSLHDVFDFFADLEALEFAKRTITDRNVNLSQNFPRGSTSGHSNKI
ncbi:unnamed protein product [Pseudo-nitzschia multistriata]|uniref:Uncharacterized protein n=1 Tax=Pseudo-nitzschia multistriata TaxID=183589 RepID=A0A448ZAJ7_9STRA|nr:unnamed protein product [Pseudo-nitzschia multistriata]